MCPHPPQPQNPQAQTSQPLRATPKPLPARLRALLATPKPSRPTLATSQRQGSKRRAQRFQHWPRGFFSRGRRFDPCARRQGPSRSKAFGLVLRSFSLAGGVNRLRAKVAGLRAKMKPLRPRSGRLQARVQNSAGGRRGGGGQRSVCRRVRACRKIFRNSPTVS